MATLEEFLRELSDDAEAALAKYHLLIDENTLDFADSAQTVRGNFDPRREVFVEFDSGNYAFLRAAKDSDPFSKCIAVQYLPWKDVDGSNKLAGCAKADLNAGGSGIFLTSQLNGCRFTIQYTDGDQKSATVLHLSGNYGGNKAGGVAREDVENTVLGDGGKDLRRRYSFRGFGNKWAGVGGTRVYYGGDKATIIGVRGNDGKWRFFAQQYDNNFKQGANRYNVSLATRGGGAVKAL